ncbi:hypothetical protein HOLleu_20992 [Holothuria leucospilota]|uniref:Uncharacterized protein n=1 Tax=Holothuria leucospilota TaxID=206669 RepID=A0A9Q1BX54_HOLLE|nr:hypothetical protein HOLleu_20992 [Holothuria leucospilota]
MMKSIKGDDTMAMKDHLTFCVVYSNAIKESDILRKMDQTESIIKLVSKLPYRMRERWRTQAHKIKEKSHRLANLNDYVEFVREQVKIATDSVYGDISVQNSKENSMFRQNRKFSKGFSTVVLEEKSNFKISEKASDDAKCLYCGFNHRLEVCRKLGAKSHEEKLAFLRSKVLHYNRKPEQKSPKDSSEEQTSKETTKQVKVSCTSTQIQESSICMGAGVSKTCLSIVPVRVKSKSTNKDVETYAFLDNGSTDTFISEDLALQLSVSGPETKIMLSTLQQEELVDSRVITNLEVCDLEGHNTLLLPKVFTQKRIPVCKDDIVTQDDLKKWPYLSRVSLPNSRAMEVGILIGNNVHKAMEPWDVINSQDDGPYAIPNRVATIIDASQLNQWSYVESSENPADDASRGLYADDLIQRHRWTNGPDFLWLPENKWPASQRCMKELSMNDPEIKKKATVAATSLTSDQTTMTKLISNSSSWFKLRCHIAWMLKLMTVFKQLSGLRKSLDGQDPKEISEKMRQERQRKLNMKLTKADMKEAELVIVKFVQRPASSDEIAATRNNSKGKPVKKTSSIYKLDPKYEDGVLRVGGRLSRSAMPEGEKHPYILPKDSIVSEMIIRETHIQLYHGGRALTMSHLRRKYWIVSAPAFVLLPSIANCPTRPISLYATANLTQVTWVEPTSVPAGTNPNEALTRTSRLGSGDYFPVGISRVSYRYQIAKCTFNVLVQG